MNWNNSIDSLLDKIRLNCVMLASKHTLNHLYYLNVSKYFEIPVIILSVFSGSFSVGSDVFIDQESISVITCSISMIITILTSIKLYMKITENSSQEQEIAINYKSMALDIFKHLSLEKEDRGVDGLIYLNKIYSKYTSLIENSHILNIINKNDKLLSLKNKFINLNDIEKQQSCFKNPQGGFDKAQGDFTEGSSDNQDDSSINTINSNPMSVAFD